VEVEKMVLDIVTITSGATTVDLLHVTKYEFEHPSHLVEVPIPTREGGQIQYLGSPQRKCTINGILITSADLTNFQGLETIRANTAADATLTFYYGPGINVVTEAATWRVEDFLYWPIKGSSQYWWGFTVKLKAKT
jgi:hypothetical protein